MSTLVGIAMGAHHTWFDPWCRKEPEIKSKKKRGIKLSARAGALVCSSLKCGAVSPADSTAQGAAWLPHTRPESAGHSLGTALVMQILTSSCVSPWQCPCQTRGPLCSVDLYLLVARRPEAFWEMPRMTLAEGPCSQSLEKWSPGEGRGKERSPWHCPLPKGNLSLRTGMAPAFRESLLPGRRPVCCQPWGPDRFPGEGTSPG